MAEMNTSSWKEFRLDELFDNPIRGTRLVKEQRIAGDIPLITAGFTNQGVAGFISNEEQKTFNGGLTIDMFGNCFFRDYVFKADDNILVFDSEDISKEAKLFIMTSINKATNGLYSYSNQYRMKAFDNTIIKLPVTSSGEIDWQYMQERIAELEQERIAELEQERIAELEHYLVASGLNDYELTEEDKSILATELFNGDDATELPSENSCRKEARKFRVGDLFEVLKITNKLSKLKLSNDGKFPVYSSDTANNGIIGFTDTPNYMCSEDVPVYITFGDHTRSFNIVRKSFSVLDNVKILRPQFVAEDEILIYIITKWKKTIPDLGYSRHWKIAKDCVLFLPIQTDTANNPIIDPKNTYHPEGYIPDWSFMEKYIRAVEKVVIKDVVDWKDEEIKKTKELVS